MRHRVALVVVLVALAGCGTAGEFLGEEPDPTPTLTPAPVPTETVTATPEPTLPDGLDRTGINNSVILGGTHADAVTGRSYTWHQHYEEVAVRPDGNRTLRRVQTSWVEGPTRYRHELTTTRRFPDGGTERYHQDSYANGTQWVERLGTATNGSVTNWTYGARNVSAGDSFATRAAFLIGRFLRVEHSTTALVERDGQPRYRVVANGSSIATHPSDGNYSAVATIGPDGLVYYFELWVTLERGNVTEHVHYVWRYENVDETTISRPDWVDDVPENATSG